MKRQLFRKTRRFMVSVTGLLLCIFLPCACANSPAGPADSSSSNRSLPDEEEAPPSAVPETDQMREEQTPEQEKDQKPETDREQEEHVMPAYLDCSEDAYLLMTEIATLFPDRDCLQPDGDHDACRDWIVKTLLEAGYQEEQVVLQDVTGTNRGKQISGNNIIVTVKGENPQKQIIAGAHYDGTGAGDNASGTALLLAACKLFADRTPPLTVHFVFFDQEEIGECGSYAFVQNMTDTEVSVTLFMINLDALAFGDYCNLYGGSPGKDAGSVTATNVYDHACTLARALGFHVYDTKALDGYYDANGTGPALDETGLFTNPWTFTHPNPSADTVYPAYLVYSPMTVPMSDHKPFLEKDIPYVYFEATNWFAAGKDTEIAYTGYYETYDVSLGEDGMFMNTPFDTLDNLEALFPGRARAHFRLYAPLLTALILQPWPS